MNYKEAYDKVLPKEKRKEEKYNLMVSKFIRPISIYMTLPLINTNIKPTSITKLSIICAIIGFFPLAFGLNIVSRIIGWAFIFLWVLLDGVDGNLARCTNQTSLLGDLWDTMGGYAAMVLIYFGTGISAFYDINRIELFEDYWYLIIGGATAIFSIFPRLVLHKKKSSVKSDKAVKDLSDKKDFSISNIVAMNIISPTGFMQLLLPLSIILHFLNIFIATYFIFNSLVMLLSLYKLLKE